MVFKLKGKKRNPEYHFFSGKGGVGKTSMAAATALWFSKHGKKVLILSTDPAHSLSDSFDTDIGGEVKKLEKNLFAVEIDPKAAMAEYKEKLMPQLEKMEGLSGLGLEGMFDMADSAPGIDEVAAFDKFLQYMHSREYDVIIFDTAPTGHALRFLSLPDVLDSWVGKMINIRMKLSGITNLFKKILPFGQSDDGPVLGTDQLEEMKKRIEDAKKILTDPRKTFYNIIMIPEQMSIMESRRMIKALGDFSIPVQTIIVNQLIPKNPGCVFCTEKRKGQQKRLGEIENGFREMDVKKIQMFRDEVRGKKMLGRVGKELHS